MGAPATPMAGGGQPAKAGMSPKMANLHKSLTEMQTNPTGSGPPPIPSVSPPPQAQDALRMFIESLSGSRRPPQEKEVY